MVIHDWLFGSDSTEEAFRLNQENIAAGIAALQSAGTEGLPLLQAIAPFIGQEFARAQATLTPYFAEARQALFAGRIASAVVGERAAKQGLAEAEMGSYARGLQGTSLAQQAKGQAAQQAQFASQAGEAAYGQQIASLATQEAGARAGLIAQGAMGQADAMAAVPQYMGMLAQAEAQMRGGITYQGTSSSGALGGLVQAGASFLGMTAIAEAMA